MSSKTKTIIIILQFLAILILLWMLFRTSYGRYCVPVIKKAEPPAAQH